MAQQAGKGGLGNENLVDVFANLDRNTLDALQLTNACFGHVVRDYLDQLCLRLIVCSIAVVPELDYKVYEVLCNQSTTEQSRPARKFHSIGDVFAHYKAVTTNGVLASLCLRHLALTDRFLGRFEAAMKGARVLGRFDVLRCEPDEGVKAIRLIRPFAEINSINIMFCSELNIWTELGAEAVPICCDKRLSHIGPLLLDAGEQALEACFGCDAVSAAFGYRRVFVEVTTLEKSFVADLLKRHAEVGVHWSAPLLASIKSSRSGWPHVDLSTLDGHEVSVIEDRRVYRIITGGLRLDVFVELTDEHAHVRIKRGKDGLYFAKNQRWEEPGVCMLRPPVCQYV